MVVVVVQPPAHWYPSPIATFAMSVAAARV